MTAEKDPDGIILYFKEISRLLGVQKDLFSTLDDKLNDIVEVVNDVDRRVRAIENLGKRDGV